MFNQKTGPEVPITRLLCRFLPHKWQIMNDGVPQCDRCWKRAVCFTCRQDAHMVVYLPAGCAAFPHTRGYVGLCPQHEYTIEPMEPYTVVVKHEIEWI